jgi:hypothetical protein
MINWLKYKKPDTLSFITGTFTIYSEGYVYNLVWFMWVIDFSNGLLSTLWKLKPIIEKSQVVSLTIYTWMGIMSF